MNTGIGTLSAMGIARVARVTVFAVFLIVGCSWDVAARQRACCRVDTIDVLCLYTPQAAAEAGGDGVIYDRMQAFAEALTTAFAASSITARVSVVQIQAMDFGGQTDWNLLNQASFDPRVAQLRDLFGADLVAVLHEGNEGWATQAGPESGPAAGFHVVPWDAHPAMYAHEVGHNLGLFHQSDTWTTARGYCRPIEEPRFSTIMGDCSDGWVPGTPEVPKLLQFSNPDVFYNGVPTGDAAHDAAAMLHQMIPIVAGYR